MIKLRITLNSTVLYRPVEVIAALPYGWTMHAAPYKTVWALHCAMGSGEYFFDSLNATHLVDKYGVAIVAPSLGNGYYINSAHERQGDFLQEELLESMRHTLPLSHAREDNYLVGISMGGFGSVRWALESGAFCAVAAISGVFDARTPLDGRVLKDRALRAFHMTFERVMKQSLLDAEGNVKPEADLDGLLHHAAANGLLPRLELFYGEQDYLSIAQSLALAELCRERGCQARVHTKDGGHNQAYWQDALDTAFACLLHEKNGVFKSIRSCPCTSPT